MKKSRKIILIVVGIILAAVAIGWFVYQKSVPHYVEAAEYVLYYDHAGETFSVGPFFTDDLKKQAWCDETYRHFGEFAPTPAFTELLSTLDKSCKTNDDCVVIDVPDIYKDCPSNKYVTGKKGAETLRESLTNNASTYLNYCGGRTSRPPGVDISFSCHSADFGTWVDGYTCYRNKCREVWMSEFGKPFIER